MVVILEPEIYSSELRQEKHLHPEDEGSEGKVFKVFKYLKYFLKLKN